MASAFQAIEPRLVATALTPTRRLTFGSPH